MGLIIVRPLITFDVSNKRQEKKTLSEVPFFLALEEAALIVAENLVVVTI